jgi:hypothetical protein
MNISPSKTSLDSLLETNKQWFEWIEAASKFESLLRDKIPWSQLDSSERTVVNSRLKSTAPARMVLLNSFYLTIVSGFEEYLRGKIREVTEGYCIGKKKYAEVAEDVRKTHVRESARLLRRIDSPPDYLSLNMDDLCRGLGSCVPGSDRVILNPEAFADVDSLVLLVNFAERIGIFGFNVGLDVLGKDAAIRDALNLPPRTGAREVAKELEKELTRMRRNRNRIAHTGGNASDVTPEVLAMHRELVRATAGAIHQIVP